MKIPSSVKAIGAMALISALAASLALADMVNADIKAYDAKTYHGDSKGAVLKTSIT
jgi:hypothetical protein